MFISISLICLSATVVLYFSLPYMPRLNFEHIIMNRVLLGPIRLDQLSGQAAGTRYPGLFCTEFPINLVLECRTGQDGLVLNQVKNLHIVCHEIQCCKHEKSEIEVLS